MTPKQKFTLLSLAIIAVSAFIGYSYSQELNVEVAAADQESFGRIAGLHDTLVENYFTGVDTEVVFSAALNGLLKELDPHSTYFDARLTSRLEEEYRGNYQGIGVTFRMFEDKITIVEVSPGGPSDSVGIRIGDQIVEIEGEAAVGIDNSEVARRLRGPDGTQVSVAVERPLHEEPVKVTITRGRIPIRSVENKFMADQLTGYVRGTRFATPTVVELEQTLQELQAAGMKRLILDLRSNGGGLLRPAIQMADKFLPGSRLILYTDGRREGSRQTFYSVENNKYWDLPLVVMIDHGSASASEIVCGALQDWDRAVVLGQTSFGKGLVQNAFILRDGSRLDLTTARYYTPTGRPIQRPYKGIDVDTYRVEAYGDIYSGPAMQTTDVGERPEFKTAAGRSVYGGGGIKPDVELEFEQFFDDFVYALNSELIAFLYAREFYWRQPDRFSSLEQLTNELEITDDMLGELSDLALEKEFDYRRSDGAKLEPEDIRARFRELADQVRLYLEAEIVKFYFGTNARFEFLLKAKDKWLSAALAQFDKAQELLALQTQLNPDTFTVGQKEDEGDDR